MPCFNHFLTLNMEVEPYQFEPTVSEEESSASDDSSDVFLDDVNEDRIGHVGWWAFRSFPLLFVESW